MHGHGVKTCRKTDAVLRRNDVELLQKLRDLILGARWLMMMPMAPSAEWAQR
jgi:hypothetical protein